MRFFFNLPSLSNASTIKRVVIFSFGMNRFFLFWYYTTGVRDAFFLFWNYVRYVPYRLHTGGLVMTLFSPWKRDVTYHTWRGFHPLKSLNVFFENSISRILGALVRLVIILFAVCVWSVVFLVGVFLLTLYIGAPFLIIFGLLSSAIDPAIGMVVLVSGIVGFIMAFSGYMLRQRHDPLTFDIAELRKKWWFHRVLGRLGLKKDSLDAEALADTDQFLEYLAPLGVDRSLFERIVTIEKEKIDRHDLERRFWLWENLHKIRPIGEDWHFAYTPHLDAYCLDLSRHDPTEYADALLVGRQAEMKVARVVLERPTQNSILLVGDPGIGKKTFVHHLARGIRENEYGGSSLESVRMLLFDIGRVVSDAMNAGEDIDNAIRLCLGEAAYAGNVILVIEDLDFFIGGDSSRHNLAPVLSSFMSLPTFRIIGTAATERYHALAKSDEQVLKSLEVIYLRETDALETFEVLSRYFEKVEKKQVIFTGKGIESIIESAERYNWEWPFPERAIDLAQETLVYWQGTDESFITPATVDAFITLKTGIPTGAISEDEKDKLLRLEECLHERVIGQNEAVKQVAEAMRKARAGFGNKKRPLGSFIFMGPSGVGKTETAKAFAESYFGSEEKMIRLDMSEYQTPESIARMIGSRDIGTHGQLTQAAKDHPFSILLLDEIEKAYSNVLDLFLQILDEGYVTDAFGEKVNFRNMVIIATSNAGAPLIKELVSEGAPMETIRTQVLDEVVKKNLFRLEFLGRFDGIIFFEPLQHEELIQVTRLKLYSLATRLKKEKNITIEFSDTVVENIVEKGFEPEFGMRSINRYIENTIEDVVVKKIIGGEVVPGGFLSVSENDV